MQRTFCIVVVTFSSEELESIPLPFLIMGCLGEGVRGKGERAYYYCFLAQRELDFISFFFLLLFDLLQYSLITCKVTKVCNM